MPLRNRSIRGHWRNISITLTDPIEQFSMSATATSLLAGAPPS
jgi:hypothetical protein